MNGRKKDEAFNKANGCDSKYSNNHRDCIKQNSYRELKEINKILPTRFFCFYGTNLYLDKDDFFIFSNLKSKNFRNIAMIDDNNYSTGFPVKKHTIEYMRQLAREVGLEKTGIEGEYLSNEYKNMKEESLWRCGKCKNEFIKSPDKVKFRREWCPRCSQNPHFLHKQIKIQDMQKLAHNVGIEKTGVPGRFLSKEYINSSTKSEWYCENCHNKFLMTPNDVKSKRSWCPRCAGREQTIEDMRNLARVVGLERTDFPGLFLSNEYKGASSKHLWGCSACGYKFYMTPNKVKSRRSWCPKCAHKVAPTLKELQKLAYDVGIEKTGLPGEFLSNKYKGSEKIYPWRCGNCKSIFEKSIDKVRHRRSWCPHCSQGYYERIFRGFMERIYSYLYKKKIIFSKDTLRSSNNVCSW